MAADYDVPSQAVAIRSPSSGAVIAGEIAVYAEVIDAVEVVGVQFMLNGARFEAEDMSPPYSITWDTATAHDGAYTLAAVARYADGGSSYSPALSVTVNNESPVAAGSDAQR